MKQIFIVGHGGPDKLQLREPPDPHPAGGEDTKRNFKHAKRRQQSFDRSGSCGGVRYQRCRQPTAKSIEFGNGMRGKPSLTVAYTTFLYRFSAPLLNPKTSIDRGRPTDVLKGPTISRGSFQKNVEVG
jgi:hypothetical protein